MRMPLLSYFVVIGAALLVGLLYLSSTMEPVGPAIQTTQMVGLPPPYKAPPEVAQQAPPLAQQADVQLPAPPPAKPVAVARKHKAVKTAAARTVPQDRDVQYPHDHYAQYPHDDLTAIH